MKTSNVLRYWVLMAILSGLLIPGSAFGVVPCNVISINTYCILDGSVTLVSPTNSPVVCMGDSVSVSADVIITDGQILTLTDNDKCDDVYEYDDVTPTYEVTWTASVGSWSTNGTGLTASFTPTNCGAGTVNFSLSYTNASPCNTGSSGTGGSFTVKCDCSVSSYVTNNTEGSVTLTNLTMTPTNGCLGNSFSASVTPGISNAIVKITTHYTNACGNVNTNYCPDTFVTNNPSPTILTNWWTVSGPGSFTTNGSGTSAGPFTPTNGGTGTVIFYTKWRHACDTNTAIASTNLIFTVRTNCYVSTNVISCLASGSWSLTNVTPAMSGCLGNSFSASADQLIQNAIVLTTTKYTNACGETTTNCPNTYVTNYPAPTVIDSWWTVDGSGGYSGGGSGLSTGPFTPTSCGSGTVTFNLTYQNNTPCDTNVHTVTVTTGFNVSCACLTSSYVTNCVAGGSVSLGSATTGPLIGCPNTAFSASVTQAVVNANVVITTKYTNACGQVTANCPDTFATNRPAPTVVSNWWVATMGGWSATGQGTSAIFTPTNPGSGTVTFYLTYKNNSPCDTNVYSATPVIVGFTTQGVSLSLSQPTVFVNADDDNSSGITDLDETNAVISSEDDLIALTFALASAPLGVTNTLTVSRTQPGAGNIKIWRSQQRGPDGPVIDTAQGTNTFTFRDDALPMLYIEGISGSSVDNDVGLSVSGMTASCLLDQKWITVFNPQLNWRGAGGMVEDGDDTCDPRPVLDFHFVGTPHYDDNGALIVQVAGTVQDSLSEIVHSAAQKVQQVKIYVNGALSSTVSLSPAGGMAWWPWCPSPFNAQFSATLTIPDAAVSTYVIGAVTSPNAAGRYAENVISVSVDWTPSGNFMPGTFGSVNNSGVYAVLNQVLHVDFTNQLSPTNVDVARVYFGNGPPTNSNGTVTESGVNTFVFSGNIELVGLTNSQVVPITISILNGGIISTNGTNAMVARVQYKSGTPPTNNVDYIAAFQGGGLHFTLTIYEGIASRRAAFVPALDGSSSLLYLPQISTFEDTSENLVGSFEPTIISVGNLTDQLTNQVIKVRVNGTEFPIKKLQDGNYYVEDPLRPGWPRFFLNSPQVAVSATAVATPGFNTDLNLVQAVYVGNGASKVVDYQSPGFTDLQTPDQVISIKALTSGWSMQELKAAFAFTFGQASQIWLEAFLDDSQHNSILLGAQTDPGTGFWMRFVDHDHHIITINNASQDVFAGAKDLARCLQAWRHLPSIQSYVIDNFGSSYDNVVDWAALAQQQRIDQIAEGGHVAANAANAYLQVAMSVNPMAAGGGIALDITSLTEGQLTAALGCVDKIPFGAAKNVVVKNGSKVFHVVEETALPVVNKLRGAAKCFARRGNSKDLGDNLLRTATTELQNLNLVMPLTAKPAGAAWHHIVSHGSKHCEEAREILAEVGLKDDIDAAWNCCPLPHTGKGKKNSGLTDVQLWTQDSWVVANGFGGAVRHADTYDAAYGIAVAARLRAVVPHNAANKLQYQQDVINVLRQIREELLTGQLP